MQVLHRWVLLPVAALVEVPQRGVLLPLRDRVAFKAGYLDPTAALILVQLVRLVENRYGCFIVIVLIARTGVLLDIIILLLLPVHIATAGRVLDR